MIVPSSLRAMVRQAHTGLCILDLQRTRNFVAPFQKKLTLRPNPAAELLLTLLAGDGEQSSLVEIGTGIIAFQATTGTNLQFFGRHSVTLDYAHLVPRLRQAVSDSRFEPLSTENIRALVGSGCVIHVSGILERVPDPAALLSEIVAVGGADAKIVISLRADPVANKAIPEDCYQLWSNDEFSTFLASLGLHLVAAGTSRHWRSFIVSKLPDGLAAWVRFVALVANVYVDSVNVTDVRREGNKHGKLVVVRAMRRQNAFVADASGVLRLDESHFLTEDAAPQVELENLDSLGHLSTMQADALLRYPRQVVATANEEALRRIEAAVKERRPLSVVRVSHAEIRALAYPMFYPPVWLNRSLKVCFGHDIDVSSYGEFLVDVDNAVRTADIIGVPVPWSRDLQHSTNALILDHEGLVSSSKFFGDLHFTLFEQGILDILASQSSKITLITSRDILSRFCNRFPDADVRHVKIPGEARWMELEGRRHVPDVYADIVREVRSREPGELFLIGAGLAAKKYCQIARDSGGVAIDIGSVFDLWAGAATRTGFEDKIGHTML
jgi:hypothetical protein